MELRLHPVDESLNQFLNFLVFLIPESIIDNIIGQLLKTQNGQLFMLVVEVDYDFQRFAKLVIDVDQEFAD